MGGCTKVVTKNAHSSFVHELSLAAGELEERYRKQQVLLLTAASKAQNLRKLLCIQRTIAHARISGQMHIAQVKGNTSGARSGCEVIRPCRAGNTRLGWL